MKIMEVNTNNLNKFNEILQEGGAMVVLYRLVWSLSGFKSKMGCNDFSFKNSSELINSSVPERISVNCDNDI